MPKRERPRDRSYLQSPQTHQLVSAMNAATGMNVLYSQNPIAATYTQAASVLDR